VAEFEEMAQVYDAFVRPFSEPIFSEALAVLADLVPRDARALDAGCGAGRELKAVARLLDRGEVVGIDLAAEMVRQARAACRAAGLDHTAFAQADVGQLPEEFDQAFDLVYCCLAHHHYPDPPKAARSIHRALRPGGIYAITDPGPEWFNATAAPMAKWSDPGWISFHTEQGFRDLLLGAGFARVRWQELLPGFALVLAQRDS
jgi:ubiquinone/menaquinone biosynthesis C-methylase UbiE